VLCDVQRNAIRLIPNALYNLFPLFNTLTKQELVMHYGEQHKMTVTEYIEFLIENEFAFYCSHNELECFPPINVSEFHTPFPITNAIVELEDTDSAYVLHLLSELNEVDCPALEIRILQKIEITALETLLRQFNDPDINIVELHIVLPENNFDLDALQELFKRHLRLTSLIISNATENKRLTDFFFGNSTIVYTTRSVHIQTCCGNFHPDTFVINIPFFTESQNHNTCLHRKVAIDKEGNIKNCPSMSKSFGNISEVKLIDVIYNEEFTAKWNINKDQIKICQDCEFRHVCMDCRAYLEDPYDVYSKPLKCGYNPYTCEWEDWSTNPLKQGAMDYYNMKDL